MKRIEEIKERADKEEHVKRDIDYYEAQEDIQYLLSRLEIAQQALEKMSGKSQILASHCAYQMDSGGNVGSAYAFEKSQEIYESLSEALKQIREE